jgi:formate dehydrogenase major subunit
MISIDEQDLGTPRRESEKLVTLSIDGSEVTVPAGTSVMRAAALAGTKVPKLCATEQLEAFGSCRLCLVQIEGMKGLPASCTTLVSAGMKVTTQSQKIAEVRLRRRESSQPGQRYEQSLLHLRCQQVHRLLAVRTRV